MADKGPPVQKQKKHKLKLPHERVAEAARAAMRKAKMQADKRREAVGAVDPGPAKQSVLYSPNDCGCTAPTAWTCNTCKITVCTRHADYECMCAMHAGEKPQEQEQEQEQEQLSCGCACPSRAAAAAAALAWLQPAAAAAAACPSRARAGCGCGPWCARCARVVRAVPEPS